MAALTFLSQLSLFELELQQKQAAVFLYICYDLMIPKKYHLTVDT